MKVLETLKRQQEQFLSKVKEEFDMEKAEIEKKIEEALRRLERKVDQLNWKIDGKEMRPMKEVSCQTGKEKSS